MKDPHTHHQFATRAIHAGKVKDQNFATSSPGIQPSVTYLLPPDLGFGQGKDSGDATNEAPWIYQRWDSPNAHQLETRVAALEGAGIVYLPVDLVSAPLADGRLVHLLPHWQTMTLPIHIVYPSRRLVPRRIRAFIDAIAAGLREA